MFNLKKRTLVVMLCSLSLSSIANANPLSPFRKFSLIASVSVFGGTAAYYAFDGLKEYLKYRKLSSPATNQNRDKGSVLKHKENAEKSLNMALLSGLVTTIFLLKFALEQAILDKTSPSK